MCGLWPAISDNFLTFSYNSASEYSEAWRYGPVFPSLYHEFKDYGSRPIKRKATDLDMELELIVPIINGNDTSTSELLDKVWDVYGGNTPTELSAMTHAEGTPWHTTWNGNPGMRNTHIEE